jgi:peptidoglycan/LPS O-acetylase OafA/YrhL
MGTFFVARIRRLTLPAFAMLEVSSVVVAALVTPPDLLRYAYSWITQPFYVQNFVFWSEGDYFQSALAKPLLHTRSLAVEEQFYPLFALSILLLHRHPRTMLMRLVASACMSLALGALLQARSPRTFFFLANGKPIYSDDNHLTPSGAHLFVPMFCAIIGEKE